MKSISKLILAFMFLSSFSVNAAVKYGNFFCDGCSTWGIKSAASSAAGNSDAKYLALDRTQGKVYEVTVIAPTYSGGAEDEEASATVYVNHNAAASVPFKQLVDISEEVRTKSNLGIEPGDELGFNNIFEVLNGGEQDFARVLQELFNSGEYGELNTVSERAENQLQLLDSHVGGGFIITFELGNVIKDSHWLVTFDDGSTVVVQISFIMVNGKVLVKVTPDITTAKDSKGKSIPLSRHTANGESYTGETNATLEDIASYYESLGLTIEDVYSGGGYQSPQCYRTGVTISEGKVSVKWNCSN